MDKINLSIFTPKARARFDIERDVHQIAEDATNTTLLEDETIRMGSGWNHVTYDTGIDLDAWDDLDDDGSIYTPDADPDDLPF